MASVKGNVYCLDCGEQIKENVTIYRDELGPHIVCPHCESSFDVSKADFEILSKEEELNFY